jgi:hypothetical protein
MINNEVADIFEKIRNRHIRIEKIFQLVANKVSLIVCSECTDICCKIDFCKESVDSSFLRFILDKQLLLYNETDGWLSKQTGCMTPYGRPFICYEYFCEKFKNDTSIKDLKYYTSLFKTIYRRTYKEQPILVLQNLHVIKKVRLDKILIDLIDLEQKVLLAFK